MELQKHKKSEFDAIKWDLYRIKCDEIDQKYSEFKKRQLKIFWWLQLASVQIIIKKSMDNMITRTNQIIQ